jgi:hypothetical protein
MISTGVEELHSLYLLRCRILEERIPFHVDSVALLSLGLDRLLQYERIRIA